MKKKLLCCLVDPYYRCVLCGSQICKGCGRADKVFGAKCPKSKKKDEHLYANIERLIALRRDLDKAKI